MNRWVLIARWMEQAAQGAHSMEWYYGLAAIIVLTGAIGLIASLCITPPKSW